MQYEFNNSELQKHSKTTKQITQDFNEGLVILKEKLH